MAAMDAEISTAPIISETALRAREANVIHPELSPPVSHEGRQFRWFNPPTIWG
jgi:hypothetical protein